MTSPGSPTATPTGGSTGDGNVASQAEVGAMFDRIAPVYDLMNALISGFQEPRWRRRLVAATGLGPGGRALDVATGSGKVASDLHRRVGPGGTVLGIDLSPGMIAVARRQFGGREGLSYLVGDALNLPTESGAFDAATIAFGMRNLPDYRQGFAEMARCVRPGSHAANVKVCSASRLPVSVWRAGTFIGAGGRGWRA